MTGPYLKSCPCCGGVAGLNRFPSCWIECTSCGLTTPTGTIDQVLAIWNQRTERKAA